VQTTTTPDRFETALCHQYRTTDTLSCDKVLIVTPVQTPGCSDGQFLTRVTADPCPACVDSPAFDFSCGSNSYLMHVFTLDKGSGQVYMDLGSQNSPARSTRRSPRPQGHHASTAFCYQTYYSHPAQARTAPSAPISNRARAPATTA
jgi:hypothetical protein